MFGFKRSAEPAVLLPTQTSPRKLPFQVTHLSFNSKEEYDSYRTRHPKVFEHVWFWQMQFGNQADPITFPGICEICDQVTNFTAPPKPHDHPVFRYQVQWWLATTCERCGLTNRDRVLARNIVEGDAESPALHHVGHYSNLRKWLSSRFADATFGHLTLGKAKRHVGDGLRSEDGTDISRDAGSLDLLLSVEVLEYVPDLSKAIAAMVRVLRPGGKALIAIPWVGQEDYEHLIKAEIGGDGFVRHLQSPGYHRDGDADEQFLRFRAFGWKLLDELRSAGFSRATAEYVFAPVHGYMTLHPIITATK